MYYVVFISYVIGDNDPPLHLGYRVVTKKLRC
jgi:hypothetical protein